MTKLSESKQRRRRRRDEIITSVNQRVRVWTSRGSWCGRWLPLSREFLPPRKPIKCIYYGSQQSADPCMNRGV